MLYTKDPWYPNQKWMYPKIISIYKKIVVEIRLVQPPGSSYRSKKLKRKSIYRIQNLGVRESWKMTGNIVF